MTNEFNIKEEQKKLVLERFKTLNPDSKIQLGSNEELTVKELINEVELGSQFGQRVVQVQIKMLQILAARAQ